MDFFDLDGDIMLNTIEIDKISNEHPQSTSGTSCMDISVKESSSESSPDRLNQGIVNFESSWTQTPSVPKTPKRKSIDTPKVHDMPIKRQSTDFIADEYFQSQFFRQIDRDSAAAAQQSATKSSPVANETDNLSQMFFSQFDDGWSQIKALKLTQLFLDDDDNESEADAQPPIDSDATPQSSQRFLHDIQASKIVPLSSQRPVVIAPPCTVYHSKNASEYMELQRTMEAINEDNLNDDNFLDRELSQAYKSSQYRREILAEISQCERSVADISNLPPPEHNATVRNFLPNVDDINWTEQFDVSPIRRPVAAATKFKSPMCVGQHATQLVNIENMNWTEKFDTSPIPSTSSAARQSAAVDSTPTTIIRDRLKANKIRLGMCDMDGVAAHSSCIEASASKRFQSLGPFFGLPRQCEKLIKDFKGIDQLYGMCVCVCACVCVR